MGSGMVRCLVFVDDLSDLILSNLHVLMISSHGIFIDSHRALEIINQLDPVSWLDCSWLLM